MKIVLFTLACAFLSELKKTTLMPLRVFRL